MNREYLLFIDLSYLCTCDQFLTAHEFETEQLLILYFSLQSEKYWSEYVKSQIE